MEKKNVQITFKSVSDFRTRISTLWQDQKDDEEYEFVFLDKETEKEFEDLRNCFAEGQQGARL